MKLLAAIMSCVKDEHRHTAIFDTWGQQAIDSGMDLFFFTGPLLGVPDDYGSLYMKTQGICKWARDRDYDYLARIDTDTYVHVPRLLTSGFEKHDYSGYVRPEFEPKYCYGPCYWMSKKLIKLVAEADWPAICDAKHWGSPPRDYEDVMPGTVLDLHGGTPFHDERYSHWFPVLPDNDKIIQHLSSKMVFTPEEMYKAHRRAYEIP